MNEKLRIKWSKMRVISVAWLSISIVFALVDHWTVNSSYSLGTTALYSFGGNLTFHIISTLIAIAIGASFLVFYLHDRLIDRPYWHGILTIVMVYISVVSVITFVMGFILVPLNAGIPIGQEGFIDAYRAYLLDSIHLRNIMLWSIVVGSTQLLLQINDKFGHGLLGKLILGKYHKAREEDRVFMFLDLKSSTATAEKLGNLKYHKFLRDYFSDMTNAIIFNKGKIYQYVGDEVVITWTVEDGISDHHCLKCYFDIKRSIQEKKAVYEERYGFIPEFKAGIHTGKVIAGEIGIVKRDITYSGDVLNTAARIQAKCNELKVSLLASEDVFDLFSEKIPFEKRSIGEIELRGKSLKVPLSTFSLMN
ncbi:adenylate/guanylate cyclase domain-containing protein [Roseivirga sp. E12]|uniref:adenylate/guanylate cyclase domain-containing protein n=1 Tax=Roseivirga sp. E12 TaxID=2819237 RepID=UPI001ABC8515|nr:adenylate/guanylate cyclase domain-containing protein [Roseivirga sp. E12]MBO3697183.1 adenylate/guanylate cyclase domain-containing protein [Roseivirga sp. E12]